LESGYFRHIPLWEVLVEVGLFRNMSEPTGSGVVGISKILRTSGRPTIHVECFFGSSKTIGVSNTYSLVLFQKLDEGLWLVYEMALCPSMAL
jgi:hypothetical protein